MGYTIPLPHKYYDKYSGAKNFGKILITEPKAIIQCNYCGTINQNDLCNCVNCGSNDFVKK